MRSGNGRVVSCCLLVLLFCSRLAHAQVDIDPESSRPDLTTPQSLLLGAGGKVVSSSTTTARSCNGTSDKLTNAIGYMSGASTFTIAFWFKPANLTQTNKYVVESFQSGGSQWAVLWEFTNNQLEFFKSGGSGSDPRTSSGITLSDTNWHHVAYRYDGTAWDKFLDGTKTSINASITFALPTLTSTPGLTVCTDDSSANWVGAAIARLYISTSALTDGQISALAGSTCSSSGVSGTTGYWQLLGSASPEPESSPSPNTNSLTLTGTTQVTGPTCSGS